MFLRLEGKPGIRDTRGSKSQASLTSIFRVAITTNLGVQQVVRSHPQLGRQTIPPYILGSELSYMALPNAKCDW